MKKTLNILTGLLLVTFLIFIFLTVVGCNHNAEDTNENSTIEGYLIPVQNVYLWNNDDGDYDVSTKKLVLKNGSKGASIDMKAFDASDYKYVMLVYENLDCPNIIFRVHYEDESLSEVFLQNNKTAAFIELDAQRKKNVTGISLMTRSSESKIGVAECSLTLKEICFVNEKKIETKPAIKDIKSGAFNDKITALELSDKIGVGLSLGSGLSACPYYNQPELKQTGYGFQRNFNKAGEPLVMNLEDQKVAIGNGYGGLAFELGELPLVSKAYIDEVRDLGFKSIRICITWYPYIIDKNYTIDPDFMARVKDVVDWALEDGLYVLLNEHHSVHKFSPSPLGYADGYNLTERDRAESERYLKAVYEQICAAFNGSYDERLIFETLNEPRVIKEDGSEIWNINEWSAAEDKEAFNAGTKILCDYNQLIVDTIRASGGNNAKRFIMVPTYATSQETVIDDNFKLPQDTANDKMMVAIHWYPLGFNDPATDTQPAKKRNAYTEEIKKEFESSFKDAYDRFISKSIPVTLTEIGIENGGDLHTQLFNSTAADHDERKLCLTDMCEIAGKYGLSVMEWDDGYVHNIINRLTNQPYESDDFTSDLIASWKKGRENYYGKKVPVGAFNKSFAVEASGVAVVNPHKGFVQYVWGDDYLSNEYWDASLASGKNESWNYCSVVYTGCGWKNIQKGKNEYDWSFIDKQLESCKKYNKTLGWRICPIDSGDEEGDLVPQYVYDEGCKSVMSYCTDSKKTIRVPDWSDPIYIQACKDFAKEMARKYDGNKYVEFIDIRCFGNWGEWHCFQLEDSEMPSIEIQKEIVDYYLSVFKKTQLVIPSDVRGEMYEYILSKEIAKRDDGLIQIKGREDELKKCYEAGLPVIGENCDTYEKMLLCSDADDYNRKWTLERWKNAINVSHMTYYELDRGDCGVTFFKEQSENVKEMTNKLGYNFTVTSADMEYDASGNVKLSVIIKNTGLAPAFFDVKLIADITDSDGVRKFLIGKAKSIKKGSFKDDTSKIFEFTATGVQLYEGEKICLGLYEDSAAENPTVRFDNKNTLDNNKLALGEF